MLQTFRSQQSKAFMDGGLFTATSNPTTLPQAFWPSINSSSCSTWAYPDSTWILSRVTTFLSGTTEGTWERLVIAVTTLTLD